MLAIDPVATAAIQPELAPGERLLWAARPHPGLVLRRSGLYQIPFSLLFGGFALFWELGVLGVFQPHRASHVTSYLVALWGIPFNLLGQHLIWGRFVLAAWRKRRTFYAVTNQRVIVVQQGFTHKTACGYLNSLPALSKEHTTATLGSLQFKEPNHHWRGGRHPNDLDEFAIKDTPAFHDIENVDAVYHLILTLRAQHP